MWICWFSYGFKTFHIRLIRSFLAWNPYGFVDFQRLKIVVNLRISVVLKKKVRVSPFSNEKASNPVNPHRSSVCYRVWMKRGKFLWWLPDFCSEIWFGSLEYFDLMLFLLILGLNSEMRLVIFFLFLLNRFGFLEFFFPSSSQSSHCDRTEFVASGDEFSAWIAESKAQWWRFKLESLRAHTNSMVLAWILFLENG